ncbi:4-hydroxy-tetrahydrodipicolinate reductase [Branchiibius cervicis]|uniref:4-hydroxy-tetrahydrodipicolinate reductase n=1 Tax=Branchiibius cervicis TaxID=908252 RepID=A0ABW2AR15_9MICO
MTRTKVAVIGAQGRMGTQAAGAVDSADDLELVGAFDKDDALGDLGGADVSVILSVPDAAPGNVAHCIDRGVHCVVGTTGWTDERLDAVRTRLAGKPSVGVLIAPNFAIGALLALEFARKAAPYFESVEVIEQHHPDKVDAPSGTAGRTARVLAQARSEAGLGDVPDATTSDPLGARGARVEGIPVHAVRLRGRVAHEEILFGGPGEALTIRHDSFDRASFMPGVLAGVRAVADHPGLTVGLEHYLNI